MLTPAAPQRTASRRWALLVAATLPMLSVACVSPEEQCAGNIELFCDADGCTCAIGAFEGESCIDEPNSTDPDACESVCCGQSEGTGGPPSVLLGTR